MTKEDNPDRSLCRPWQRALAAERVTHAYGKGLGRATPAPRDARIWVLLLSDRIFYVVVSISYVVVCLGLPLKSFNLDILKEKNSD